MSDIEGQVITDVRHLSDSDHDELSWTVTVYDDSVILELSDGSILIPVNDVEGNKPGIFSKKNIDTWDDIIGSRISSVSPMSRAAMEYRGWDNSSRYRPPVLTLDTREQLYPSTDPEENRQGILFRITNTETFVVDFESLDIE